jgi:hypothetical protein
LLAATDEDGFTDAEIEALEYAAKRERRAIVLVGRDSTDRQLSWTEFLDALGGAVPAWRALTDFFPTWLLEASLNRLPPGQVGEAWRLFEDLVADGLGFVLGRKVLQLGARKRGKAVSDMIAQVPTEELLVVDAKAASGGFDVSRDSLRPLVEYTKRQIVRQRGHHRVLAALVISSSFRQDDDGLNGLARWFLGDVRVPLSFAEARLLVTIVDRLKQRPVLRSALRWDQLLTGGRIDERLVVEEIAGAGEERYPGRGH